MVPGLQQMSLFHGRDLSPLSAPRPPQPPPSFGVENSRRWNDKRQTNLIQQIDFPSDYGPLECVSFAKELFSNMIKHS